jgi:hypothetical protein
MFDDQQGPGNAPPNLPTGEPEDIFSGTSDPLPSIDSAGLTETVTSNDREATPASTAPSATPSALDAGVLKPSSAASEMELTTTPTPSAVASAPLAADPSLRPYNPVGAPAPMSPPVPTMDDRGLGNGPVDMIKEPIGSRKTMIYIVIVVAFLVLGVGGLWMYFAVVRNAKPDTIPTIELTPVPEIVSPTPVVPESDTVFSDVVVPSETSSESVDGTILFGDSVPDTDSDGLDDVREASIGTDALNWDSDGDELSDGDEVIIWKTDPLSVDSDSDGFEDGVEVKNGYSPTGPGKIFEPPTSTQN